MFVDPTSATVYYTDYNNDDIMQFDYDGGNHVVAIPDACDNSGLWGLDIDLNSGQV